MNKRTVLIFKSIVVVIWLLLLGGLLKRDVFITSVTADQKQVMDRADSEEYQGIYFRDAKIGYVINNYSSGSDNSLKVDQKALMKINVSNVEHLIELELHAILRQDNTLDTFSFNFDSPFYRMSAEGRVDGQSVRFTLRTGSNTIENSIAVDSPPMLPTARRGYLLRENLKAGDKVKIPSFDPVSLTARSNVVEYRGREKELINGRVFNLHKFTEDYSGARINFWLDENGDVVKEESPAGFVFLKEPKFKALALDESSEELLSSVAVKVVGTMPDVMGLKHIQYRLSLPEGESFDLDGGRQTFRDSILAVTLENLNEYPAQDGAVCPDAGNSLKSTPYIQSEDPVLVEQALEITNGTSETLDKVRRLAGWVFEHLEKRPVLGIPDARTTYDNRVGDCNEHAALFAALARSAGIPTHIAAGVVYHKGAFYYHAWNEVCVAGKWLSLDTTTNQLPADVSHIKFLRGELDEQVRIGSLIGNLGIEILSEKEQ